MIDVDRERAAEELGWHRNKEAALRLRDLEQGEFYAFGPALVKAVTKVRIGSVQTSHPEIGARTAPPPPPREKVVAILGKLADLPKEAAEEEAEIVRLRRQVAETRAELARRPTVQIPEPVQVEIPAIDEVAMRRLESVAVTFREGVDGLREFARTLYERADQTKAAVERLLDSVVRFRQNGARRQELVRPRHTTPPEPQRIRVNRPFKAEEFPDMRQGRLGKGELKILRAIAQHYDEGATREQLTVLTGYKRSSRDTYLQRLRAWALVTDEGGRIQVTDAGIAALGPQFEPLPTGDALRVHWMERLPEGERKVLGVLVEAWPAAVDRETITEAIGYQRSSRDTYLQRLRSRRLVTVEARGQVRAADMLFDTAPVRAR